MSHTFEPELQVDKLTETDPHSRSALTKTMNLFVFANKGCSAAHRAALHTLNCYREPTMKYLKHRYIHLF